MATQTAGVIKFKIDGVNHFISGGIEYATGENKREEVIGADGRVAYKETPTVAYVKGKSQDYSDFDFKAFQNLKNVQIVLELGIGKSYFFNDCFYKGEGKGNSENGELEFEFTAAGGCEAIS